jgi:hypothetical protein
MSREEILAAMRECAAKLKRNPSLADLQRMKNLERWNIRACFGRLSVALRAAGLEPRGSGYRPTTEALLLDWARVAREQGELPSLSLYVQHGRYSYQPFLSNFGRWSGIAHWFGRFVRQKQIASKWKDVLAMILKKDRPALHSNPKLDPGKHRPDRPVYGPPLLCPGVAHEPVNESGVIYLFGALAQRLGFVMLRMQTGFPDCEAMREVGPGHWQRVRIEFEFSSRSFKHHGHRKQDCDLIVCWIHDWPSCPKQLEVLELRTIVRGREDRRL